MLPPIYDAVRHTTPGFVERTPAWWRTYRLDDPVEERGGGGPLQCCVFNLSGVDAGYVLYRIHDAYERRLHHDWVEVVEAVDSSAAATRATWTYLFGLSLVERVRAKFLPEDHPLTLMLREPGSLRLTVWDGLWLRLIDVGAALAARSYSAVGSIVLEVVDPLFEANAARWRIDAGASESRGEPLRQPSRYSAECRGPRVGVPRCVHIHGPSSSGKASWCIGRDGGPRLRPVSAALRAVVP